MHFVAKDIILGPGWGGDGTDYSILPGYTCSDQCTDCCTPTSQLTYDPPANPFILTPNGDENNDIFYITDYANPYDAYNSTAWIFTIWPKSGIGWYPPSQVIWSQQSVNGPLPFAQACFLYETPTPEYPYNTFFWDGDFQFDGSVYIDSDFEFYNAGDPAPAGIYYYEVDLYGCNPEPGAGIQGHHLHFEGEIGVLANKSPENLDPSSEHESEEPFTKIEPDLEAGHFSVYPNPTANEVIITLSSSNTYDENRLELTDASGKLVLETTFAGTYYLLSLGELGRGTYFLRVTNDSGEYNEKIVLH